MNQVIFKHHPSIHAAYQKNTRNGNNIGVSLASVYDKLNGIEATTSTALVRYSAESVSPIIKNLSGEKKAWLKGYKVRLLEGLLQNQLDDPTSTITALSLFLIKLFGGKFLKE